MRIEIWNQSKKENVRYVIALCFGNSSIESGVYASKRSAKKGAQRLLERLQKEDFSKVKISD